MAPHWYVQRTFLCQSTHSSSAYCPFAVKHVIQNVLILEKQWETFLLCHTHVFITIRSIRWETSSLAIANPRHMLFSKPIEHYSLYVKSFLPLALCVSLCAVSPPNKQRKKKTSLSRDIFPLMAQKNEFTLLLFFLLSDGINRQYVTTQPPSCKHQYVIGRCFGSLLSRSVVHRHAKWRRCSASVSDTVPVRNAAPSVPRERGRLALLYTVMQKQLDADFPPPALHQMVCELQRTFAEPLVQFTVGCRSHRTSLSLPSERGV